MKYFIQLNNIEMIDEFAKKEVYAVTVGLEHYSSGAILECSIEQLNEICNKVHHRMRIYVLLNQLYHQHDIKNLEEVLKQLALLSIDGIFFQDFGLLQLVQEKNRKFDMVYAPDTLNTNHQTLNTLFHLGIDKFFLSGQLHLDEVKTIVEKCIAPCIIPIHGVQYISYSKRKLLSNYFDQIAVEQGVDYKENLMIKVNNKEEYSHIYEDHSGTHIYTTNELCTLGLDIPGEYGYIETLYLDDAYILEVLKAYQENLNFADFKKSHPDHCYDCGFLEDGTVYKIEDVRKREEDEKR